LNALQKEAARKALQPKGPGDGTQSVMSFKRDEYLGQRALYVAAYGVGYFAGAPEGMMNIVRKAEQGVGKVGSFFFYLVFFFLVSPRRRD
jgi:hypothetical protein